MIDKALQFIVAQLNAKFTSSGQVPLVSLPKDVPDDAVKLADTAVTVLLVRMEEERVMRHDEPYMRGDTRKTENRKASNAFPPVVLNLFVLFVARVKDYDTGLKRLSDIVTFFQGRPAFYDTSEKGMPELRFELHSPTFTVQNEIWSALRLPLHPSVMYKVTLVLLETQEKYPDAALVTKIEPARQRPSDQSPVTNDSPINLSIVNHSS